MPFASKQKQADYWRQYYQKNKKKVDAYKRGWNQEHKVQLRDAQRARYAADPEKYRQYYQSQHIKRTYGLSEIDYAKLLVKQDGKCAICGGPPSMRNKSEMKLHVDHRHSTGAVRGLLCSKCNRGLGLFMDSADNLKAALVYLDGAQKEER
jgi:hypothetical protein